jgi:hypothetical protein
LFLLLLVVVAGDYIVNGPLRRLLLLVPLTAAVAKSKFISLQAVTETKKTGMAIVDVTI